MINKIKELIKKYLTFIKYVFSAGISFALDYALFALFSYLLKAQLGNTGIIVGQYSARAISSFVNYRLNRNRVFESNADGKKVDSKSLIQFIILVVIQATVSAFAIYYLTKITSIDEKIIYVPVQCILFVVNYYIQKIFIFKKNTKA